MPLVDPVAGAKFQLDAYSVDAAGNVYRSHGEALRLWKDGGASSPPALTTASVYERPHLQIDEFETSVNFDGVDDRLLFPSSASRFSFIHTTGIFDLFFAFRLVGAGVRSLFGCMTDTATDKGMAVLVNADGKLVVAIGDGSASLILSNAAMELAVPRFEPTMLHIRGTGTELQASLNLYDYYEDAYTGAVGSGDAVDDYTIGATSMEQTIDRGGSNAMLQGELFWASLYTTNLSATQLDTMRACLASRIGGYP